MAWKHKEVPLFSLEDGQGGVGGTQSAWQRKEIVWATLHPPGCEACDALEARLMDVEQSLQAPDVLFLRTRTVGGGAPGALVDPDGHQTARLAEALEQSPDVPQLVVANRYLELYAAQPIHGRSAATAVAEALKWLDLAQEQCAECAAPVEWAEER